MDIVLTALRFLILSYDSNSETKEEALAEYVKRSIPPPNVSPLAGIADFHAYRLRNRRIQTIKFIRERINCGLMEAVILVKGIESHYDIND